MDYLHIDIVTEMMQDFYAIDSYPIDLETSKKLFKTFLDSENFGRCWLISDDEKIIGYVILTFIFSFEYKGRISFLDELYIKSTYRGKGIGQKTIEFIKIEAQKLDLKLIYLEVENHNDGAQNLYLKNNFEFHNRKIMKFKIEIHKQILER